MSRDATGIYSAWAEQKISCPVCGVAPGEPCKIQGADNDEHYEADEYVENGVHWKRTESAPPYPPPDTRSPEEIERQVVELERAVEEASCRHRITVVFEYEGDHEICGLVDDMLDEGALQGLIEEWAGDKGYEVEFTSSLVTKFEEEIGDEAAQTGSET